VEIQDSNVIIGGMAKGSGMIHPKHGYNDRHHNYRCKYLQGTFRQSPEGNNKQDFNGYL
jgi:hypothetical protein